VKRERERERERVELLVQLSTLFLMRIWSALSHASNIQRLISGKTTMTCGGFGKMWIYRGGAQTYRVSPHVNRCTNAQSCDTNNRHM
jgi:hypothetical protein